MEIRINKIRVSCGWKSYVAHCCKLYEKGLMPRFDINKILLETKLNSEIVSSFVSYYLGERLSKELYSFLTHPRNKFLLKEISNPIILGALCLYIERSADIPLLRVLDWDIKRNWFYSIFEELIQYPPESKLCEEYLSLIGGPLPVYVNLAKFYSNTYISNKEVLEEFEFKTDSKDKEERILNSIDECGILLRKDEEGFTWADSSVVDWLRNYSYRRLLWSKANKLVRHLNLDLFH